MSYIKKLTAITLAIVLAFGLNIVIAKAAWTSAPSTPPQNNVDAPINVGASDQTKNALLTVKGLWSTAGGYFSTMIGVATLVSPLSLNLVALFNGKIGAVAYCDVNGANCVTSSSLANIATTTAATSTTTFSTTTINNTVPAGAVMSFDLSACPVGWATYTLAAGRNIIGVGAGTGLTARTRGQTGGEEKHTQTLEELVPHRHMAGNYDTKLGYAKGWGYIFSSASGPTWGTSYEGGGQPFNVMDPYVALLYCKKI